MSIHLPHVEGPGKKTMAYTEISQNEIHFIH